jgi:hypothetical protein
MTTTASKRVTELRREEWWEFIAVEAHEAVISPIGEIRFLPSRMYYGQLLSWDVPLGIEGLVHMQIGNPNSPKEIYCEKSVMVKVTVRS